MVKGEKKRETYEWKGKQDEGKTLIIGRIGFHIIPRPSCCYKRNVFVPTSKYYCLFWMFL